MIYIKRKFIRTVRMRREIGSFGGHEVVTAIDTARAKHDWIVQGVIRQCKES